MSAWSYYETHLDAMLEKWEGEREGGYKMAYLVQISRALEKCAPPFGVFTPEFVLRLLATIEALQAEGTTLRTALLDVQAIQSEYDRKPYLIPVGGWMAIRERLQHADVREAIHGTQ